MTAVQPHGGILKDFFANRIKSWLKSEIADVLSAIKNGDLNRIDGFLDQAEKYLIEFTGVKVDIRAEEIVVVFKIAAAVYTQDWASTAYAGSELLKCVGDRLTPTLPRMGSAAGFELPGEVIELGEGVQLIVGGGAVMQSAPVEPGEVPPPQEGIVEIITIASFIIKLIQWRRERRAK